MKHLQLVRSIAILITALFYLSSCKKSHEEIIQTSFSRMALGYVQLEQGKYFIYRDSTTLAEDSVVVAISNLENHYAPKPYANCFCLVSPAHYYEDYYLMLINYGDNFQKIWFEAKAYGDINTGNWYTADTIPVLMKETNSNGDCFNGYESLHSDLTMNVEGKTYNNVIECMYENGPDNTDPAYIKTVYYWARPVGIIKRTTITGTSTKTYTLLRNN